MITIFMLIRVVILGETGKMEYLQGVPKNCTSLIHHTEATSVISNVANLTR